MFHQLWLPPGKMVIPVHFRKFQIEKKKGKQITVYANITYENNIDLSIFQLNECRSWLELPLRIDKQRPSKQKRVRSICNVLYRDPLKD